MAHQRIIAHFDLDTFFVSVERLNDPSLVGKPVIVGGTRERGVVSTCSYETRVFGVHSGMPMAQAMKLCPDAIVLQGTRGDYSRYSRWVTEIIAAKAPLFQKASIDEFYIDLTGMDRFFDPVQWTVDLRKEIIDATQLPISFAMAANKLVAKIATDQAKPNNYIVVPAGKEKEFLAPLRVNKIPGIGEKAYHTLLDLGIETIGDLQNVNPVMLEQQLGKHGRDLWQRAHGISFSEVNAYHESKSISSENTFHENRNDMAFLEQEIVRLTEKIAYELRQENKMAGCVSVKIRYPSFETQQRQASVPYTNYDDELIYNAKQLFHQLYKKGQPVRLLGVRLSELTDEAAQTNLFQDVQKKNDLYKAIDDVKGRFGKALLTKGRNAKRRDDDELLPEIS
nr:DNA polymerase IV [uncultured Lacibacter sp.]